MNKKYIDLLNDDADRIRKLPKEQQSAAWAEHYQLSLKYSPYDENGELKDGAIVVPVNPELGLFKIEFDPEIEELPKEG